MLDIHSHVIYGLDDGAKDLKESLEMAKIYENEDINTVIATPHYIRGVYNNDFFYVEERVEELQSRIYEEGINLELIPAQEVFLDNKILQDIKSGEVQGINKGKYMLVEFNMEKLPKNTLDLLYEIKIKGFFPIVAHPERYLYFLKDKELINDFINEGMLFQINSGSLMGKFGKEVQKLSKKFVENGVCNFIASDAHGSKHRTPCVKEGLESVYSIDKDVEGTIRKNFIKLLNNDEILQKGQLFKKKRGIFDIFKK